MSIDIGYFFNSEKDFEQLCDEMNKHLDFNFKLSEDHKNHVYDRFLGIGFDFYIHSFESDEELNLEAYKYFLDVTPRPFSKDVCLSILAFIANVLYRQIGVSEGILVRDLAVILASYEERLVLENIKNLFDNISNKFVEFPQHLTDLDKLAWQ